MNEIDDYELMDKDWDQFIKKGMESFGIIKKEVGEENARVED